MADKRVQMKWKNGNEWENLYPEIYPISKTLWAGSFTENDKTITLLEPVTDYLLLMVVGSGNHQGFPHDASSNILNVTTTLNDGGNSFVVGHGRRSVLLTNGTEPLYFEFTSPTTIKTLGGFSETNRLTKVTGLFKR